jgi:predicted O-linked N-acetylglucosamine transferase (SPINDLY family)
MTQRDPWHQVHMRAKAAFKAGDVHRAVRIYEEALAKDRQAGSLWRTLGELYLWTGMYEEAFVSLKKAWALGPICPELLERVVLAICGRGHVTEAMRTVSEVFKRDLDFKARAGTLARAVSVVSVFWRHIEQRTRIDNDQEVPLQALGLVADILFRAGQMSPAESVYYWMSLYKADPFVWARLAHIYRFQGALSKARDCLEKAAAREPDNAEYQANLGNVKILLGEHDAGMALLREAVGIQRDHAGVHSNLLIALHYAPDPDRQVLFEEHKRWGQRHAPLHRVYKDHSNDPDPDRRLRVGYLSSDLRMHSVAYNIAAFISSHRSQSLEVYGYGHIRTPDGFTDVIQSQCDHYRHIVNINDEQVANLIREDRIDILVVMGGHTLDQRLGVCALKPAPVQVAYGSINTLGMEQMDYRLTDALLDLPESQPYYLETLVYIPDGLICYKPPLDTPAVGPLPAQQQGYITFGSFNGSQKVHPLLVSMWAQVIKQVAGSRFILKCMGGDDPALAERLHGWFQQAGIDKQRVEIHGWTSPLEHLQLYQRVDIALDTYPYNGSITTLEGLWMGVPAVTLMGEHYISRVGLSILSRVGLELLVTGSPDEFVTKAVYLAENVESLARTRLSLRDCMAASPLCDSRRFAEQVEAAYRHMWHTWCHARGVTTDLSVMGPEPKDKE